MIVNELCAKSTLSKEDWVLVKYKGRMFPGIVKKIESEGAEVSVKGKKYRTGLEVAKKNDLALYFHKDILEKLPASSIKPFNNCSIFKVESS